MKEFIEKLIGRLEEQKEQYKRARENTHCVITETSECDSCKADHYLYARLRCTDRTIEIVNQLAEEYNNGWIPCSERLPGYLDNVFICTKNGGRTIAHLKHTPIEWRDMYMNKIDDVIAWKHLDNPYQPKGE